MNYFKAFMGICKAHAPEILTVSGIVLSGAAVGTAIWMTPKAIAAKQKMEKLGENIVVAKEEGKTATGEIYTEKDYKSDLLKHTVNTCWEVGKYYIPTALCFIGGGACTVGALGIMKARNAAITTVATTAVAALAKYRENVVAMDGKEKDLLYLEGKAPSEIKAIEAVTQEAVLDEEGNIVEPAVTDTVTCRFIDGAAEKDIANSPLSGSPFTIRLDERFGVYQSCSGNPYYIRPYIEAKLKEVNHVLSHSKDKTVTFAEVLDIFGVDKNRAEFKDINFQVANMCIASMNDKLFDTNTCKFVENTPCTEITISNIDDVFLDGTNDNGKNTYYLDFQGFEFKPGHIAV